MTRMDRATATRALSLPRRLTRRRYRSPRNVLVFAAAAVWLVNANDVKQEPHGEERRDGLACSKRQCRAPETDDEP